MSTASSSYDNATAGPSSPATRKTFYPQWPESHDEAEYYEIPPDHFLAQQRGTQKAGRPQPPAASALPTDRRSFATSLDRRSSTDSSGSATLVEPLAELANAIQNGMPVVPMPSASAVAAATQRAVQDAIPTLASFAEAHEEMPDTSTLAAADFDVDVRSGFLPPEAPVVRLNGKHEQTWETALDHAKSIPLMQGGGGAGITSEQRLLARRWRRSIREMPVLPLSGELASDIRYARRGHLVLAFLAHFYIHSQPPPVPEAAKPSSSWRDYFSRKAQQQLEDDQDVADELSGKFSRTLPASIAVPWVQLSQKLGLPPVLTYATTVLWNWGYIDPEKGLALDNIRMLESFTNTKSEEHFYLTSALIEIRGVEALELMRVSLDEAFVGDILSRRRIAAYLNRLAVVIAELSQLLHDVRSDCDPKVFYWGIRPWFRGSDAAEGGETPGWHFEGVDPAGVRRSFSGPSAGQSSVIHAIDVFLDVDHTRTKPRLSRPAVSPSSATSESEAISGDSRGADATFMERMQLYMPGHHRNFLTHLRSISFDDENAEVEVEDAQFFDAPSGEDMADETEAHPVERPPPVVSHPIRSLAVRAQEDGREEGLPAAYDNALNALKTLRDGHMKVAYLYIIAQARGTPPNEYAPLPKGFTGVMGVEDALKHGQVKQLHAEDVLEAADNSKKGAKGTGGTDLVSFLKDCRVNTTDALITAAKTAKSAVQGATTAAASAVAGKDSKIASGGAERQSSSSTSATGTEGQSRDESNHPSEPPSLGKSTGTDLRPRSSPSLGGLQVWAIDVAGWDADEERFSSLVDELLPGPGAAGDREKVRKYYRQIDRTRSLAARLLPRLMFSQVYGVDWQALRFASTPEGRPFLAGPELPEATDFNITHDSDWVAMAFHVPAAEALATPNAASRSAVQKDAAAAILAAEPVSPSRRRVGIDVMQISLPRFEKDVRSFCETMDLALTPDEQRWVLGPLSTPNAAGDETEALSRLFDLWTHKEAFTKNVGKGLGFDFKTVELAFYLIHGPREMRSTAALETPSRNTDAVLRIKGQVEKRYKFTEITLSSSSAATGKPASQCVVAEGPFDELGSSSAPAPRQISPPIRQQEAINSGLLKVFKMEELIAASRERLGPH